THGPRVPAQAVRAREEANRVAIRRIRAGLGPGTQTFGERPLRRQAFEGVPTPSKAHPSRAQCAPLRRVRRFAVPGLEKTSSRGVDDLAKGCMMCGSLR